MAEARRLASLAAATLFAASAMVGADPAPSGWAPGAADSARRAPAGTPPEAAAALLYGVPDGLALASIVGKPTLLGTVNYLFKDGDERRLAGYVDVVAVYDLPLEAMAAALVDFEAAPGYVPHILAATVRRRGPDGVEIYYKSGFRVLGIEISYESVFLTAVDRLDGGAVGIRSLMLDSLDDRSFEHYTSTYLAPVVVDGRPMTFVRYFNRPGLRKPGLGLLQVLNLFVSPEAKAQLEALEGETRRRLER